MEPLLGLLLGLILAVPSSAQNNCTCATNKWTVCDQDGYGSCSCTLVRSNHRVNCSSLTPKCLLMKAEILLKDEYSQRLLDTAGIYNPDCEEDNGVFKARQCDQTGTCWCVNTAGIRRTEKGDRNLNCGELVRTSWIYIEMKHKGRSSAFSNSDVENALRHLFESRYKLPPKFVTAMRYNPWLIQINLRQQSSQKSPHDVDIADVAYYFEKDVKDDSLFHSNRTLIVPVNGEALVIENIWIHYVDEIPPQFSMKQLAAGISGVVTVVALTAGFGIALVLILRWLRTRKYKKVEMKETGDVRPPSLQ
ncbi:TACD2 protein, partial [Turnix velox]|nr:TACD2 protein [Turnix velox]